jgi:tetratricopeptide (TPR) repeat protein
MKRTACSFLVFLALAGGAYAQGQRRIPNSDTNSAPRPSSTLTTNVTSYPWFITSGDSVAPPSVPPAGGGPSGASVSVAQLRIPTAAMKELQVFQQKFAAGKLEEAAHHVEKAIRIYPQLAGAHHNLGQCYARLNQFDKAIAEFQTATALDAQLVPPRVSLAESFLIQGKFEEGEAAARGALELDPVNMQARYLLGSILVSEKHGIPEAIDLLRKSRDAIPEARLVLARTYLAQHATDDAVQELRGYLEQPNVPAKEKIACVVEKLTKPEGSSICATK